MMSTIKRNDMIFPSLMNEIFNPDWFGGLENQKSTIPAVNIIENEINFELELVAPGRNKEDFTIEIDDKLLTVSSDLKKDKKDLEDNYTRREFNFSSFKRAFTLPETIASDKITAAYKNGILKFTLPKNEDALPKPKRLIELG